MNPLQEYPHLFSNNKFKANTHYSINHRIIGIIGQNSFYLEDEANEEVFVEKIENCTLIARPIEDMTEGELARVLTDNLTPADYSSGELEECRKALIEEANNKSLYLEDAKNMAEIGVYFGPQSHFDDGTVIDSRTI